MCQVPSPREALWWAPSGERGGRWMHRSIKCGPSSQVAPNPVDETEV